MLIMYDSRAGKVKRFVDKLNMNAHQINEKIDINEPFIFVTYTDGRGEVPITSLQFLAKHSKYLYAVAASGNKVFESFAASADVISNMYNVPIVHKFEMAGITKDVELFRKWVVNNGAYLVK